MDKIFSSAIRSLKESYNIQRRLFEEGVIGKLVFLKGGVDKTTKGDWESEESIINFLRQSRIPLRIISEEHGNIDLEPNPEYLAVLDGIDGSSALVKNPSTRCGSMLTISSKLHPKYNDFVFAGITEYATNRIVYGIKGEGVFEIKFDNGKETRKKISNFKEKPFSGKTVIGVDCYRESAEKDYALGITEGMSRFEKFMEESVARPLKGKGRIYGRASSSALCLDLIDGDTDAVAQIVAKGVFEPPAMYLLTKELGGYGADLHGSDLGNKKWKAMIFNDEKIEIEGAIFASSKQIGKSITDILKR